LPSLYVDILADAPALRRRISGAFLRSGWSLEEEPQTAELVLVDSAIVSEASIDSCAELSVKVIVLVWGADDPIFATKILQRVDGVVDRDDPEDDWLRAAHEVRSGFGWISPHLFPRYRSMMGERTASVSLDPDTWKKVLSFAEYDVARLVVHGMSNAEIAEKRWVRESTIKQQLTNVYRKLGIRGRASLISLGYRKKRF
jgi:DNA-binding NarL/FixJ family response regulator